MQNADNSFLDHVYYHAFVLIWTENYWENFAATLSCIVITAILLLLAEKQEEEDDEGGTYLSIEYGVSQNMCVCVSWIMS